MRHPQLQATQGVIAGLTRDPDLGAPTWIPDQVRDDSL
jgi:hypothetical protein